MKIQVKERQYLIPSFYQVLHEDSTSLPEDILELSNHFNDVYKLYLRQLAKFELVSEIDATIENGLARTLSELIRIKRRIQESA